MTTTIRASKAVKATVAEESKAEPPMTTHKIVYGQLYAADGERFVARRREIGIVSATERSEEKWASDLVVDHRSNDEPTRVTVDGFVQVIFFTIEGHDEGPLTHVSRFRPVMPRKPRSKAQAHADTRETLFTPPSPIAEGADGFVATEDR